MSFFWTIKQIFVSLILIFVVHNLYLYFVNNLTNPEVKDLVERPAREYNEIYSQMNKPEEPPFDESMKMDLKNYLKQITTTASFNDANKFAQNRQRNMYNAQVADPYRPNIDMSRDAMAINYSNARDDFQNWVK